MVYYGYGCSQIVDKPSHVIYNKLYHEKKYSGISLAVDRQMWLKIYQGYTVIISH
jgi:hypothetical protein